MKAKWLFILFVVFVGPLPTSEFLRYPVTFFERCNCTDLSVPCLIFSYSSKSRESFRVTLNKGVSLVISKLHLSRVGKRWLSYDDDDGIVAMFNVITTMFSIIHTMIIVWSSCLPYFFEKKCSIFFEIFAALYPYLAHLTGVVGIYTSKLNCRVSKNERR